MQDMSPIVQTTFEPLDANIKLGEHVTVPNIFYLFSWQFHRWKCRSRMPIPIEINANFKWPFCPNHAVLGPFEWMRELYKRIVKGTRVAQFAKWNAEKDFAFWNQSLSRNYWEEGK